MKFEQALKEMKRGIPMKLPSWGGYWCWDDDVQSIIMYTKDNQRLDIRETQRVEYTLMNVLSDEWISADPGLPAADQQEGLPLWLAHLRLHHPGEFMGI